jgi:LmbE family N-acetylglucosaminyl deacetylase
MIETLKLMAVLAHPDDESMGMGTTFARYAAEGVETYLVCATRGERGWTGPDDEDPGMQEMARIRTAELLASAQVLDICQVFFLDYIDGDVDQVRPGDAIARIVHLVRLVRPQVVCTFNLDGAYGHPDHIAVSQFTAAALVCAADPSYPSPQSPHRVSKFYYMAGGADLFAAFTRTFGDLSMEVDGVKRTSFAWPDWAMTARIDGDRYWETAWKAVQCHASQLAEMGDLSKIPESDLKAMLGRDHYLRAFSLVNGGRRQEDDLFAGLR